MLNEDKIKLMTGIALFEKREGKHIFPANRYFRSDYISGRILRSFFAYTVCFILCALMWVLYSMERLLNVMELDEVVGAAKAGAVLYEPPDPSFYDHDGGGFRRNRAAAAVPAGTVQYVAGGL